MKNTRLDENMLSPSILEDESKADWHSFNNYYSTCETSELQILLKAGFGFFGRSIIEKVVSVFSSEYMSQVHSAKHQNKKPKFLRRECLCARRANIPRGDQVFYSNHGALIKIIPGGASMPVVCKSNFFFFLGKTQMSPDNTNPMQIKCLIILSTYCSEFLFLGGLVGFLDARFSRSPVE